MTTPRYAPDLVPGTVTLVGGGPGDPGLLTLAGYQAVCQADVILYDRLAPQDVLDEAPGAQKIPVGKVPQGPFVPQERINQLLVEHARAGRRVVRLKGGDSFVFGRGGEEWQACAAAGVPVRVIPGVTSSVAGPELAGIPLTHRHMVQGFTVVSGHVAPGDSRSVLDWSQLAKCGTTLVILMGVTHIRQIAEDLICGGLDAGTPVAVVRRASLPGQSVMSTTLASVADEMAAAEVRPPAIVVVGDVAGLDLDHTDAAVRHPSDH
jgi:uroporphyrin-III C-methyltransferase